MKNFSHFLYGIPVLLLLAMGVTTSVDLIGLTLSLSNVEASVANKSIVTESGKFENHELGIIFDVFPLWNSIYQDNETMILLHNDTMIENAPGFIISKIPLPADNMNEEFLVAANLLELTNSNSSSYVIIEESKANITQQQLNSHKALLSDGKEYTLAYMFKFGNDFFTIVFSAPKTLFDALLPEVQMMLDSLEFAV